MSLAEETAPHQLLRANPCAARARSGSSSASARASAEDGLGPHRRPGDDQWPRSARPRCCRRRALGEQVGMQVLRARASDLEQELRSVVRQLFEGPLDRADPATRPSRFRGAAARPAHCSTSRRWRPPAATFSCTAAATAGGRPAGDLSFTLVHGLYWLTNNLSEVGARTIAGAHWADASRFLAYLSARCEELGVLVALTAREGEPTGEPRGAHHPAQGARCDSGDARLPKPTPVWPSSCDPRREAADAEVCSARMRAPAIRSCCAS